MFLGGLKVPYFKAIRKRFVMAESDLNINSIKISAGFRLNFEGALSPVDQWTRILHPNIIAVKEAFTTKDFGDSCTFANFCILGDSDVFTDKWQ